MENKTLKFRDFKAKWILEGKKTSSMRLFDEKDIKEGDDLDLINWNTGEKFVKVKVVKVIVKKISELLEDDFKGHEKFENMEKMMESFRKYYGDKVNQDTIVKIIRFKLLKI